MLRGKRRFLQSSSQRVRRHQCGGANPAPPRLGLIGAVSGVSGGYHLLWICHVRDAGVLRVEKFDDFPFVLCRTGSSRAKRPRSLQLLYFMQLVQHKDTFASFNSPKDGANKQLSSKFPPQNWLQVVFMLSADPHQPCQAGDHYICMCN